MTPSRWATQATVTTPQIIFKQLNLNVLKAPTLAETIGDGVVDNNNQLTYTFKWTQDDMKAADAAPDYQIKLYGLLTNADGKVTGQEQIALKYGVNLAMTSEQQQWQQLYPACQRGYHAGQRQRQLAL